MTPKTKTTAITKTTFNLKLVNRYIEMANAKIGTR